MADERAQCVSCNGLHPVALMHQVEVLACRQTHSSPAEYEDAWACDACFNGDGPDEDYERANQVWRETHGGEL